MILNDTMKSLNSVLNKNQPNKYVFQMTSDANKNLSRKELVGAHIQQLIYNAKRGDVIELPDE